MRCSLVLSDLFHPTPIAPTRLTHPSARRSARRPTASSARVLRCVAAPSSQGADAVASRPRLAAPTMRLAAFLRGSLHAALQDASTWLAQQIKIEVLVPAIEHLFGHASAAPDWLMRSGVPRGASRVRDSRQWLRRRGERRREEQQGQTLATGEPRESGSAHAGECHWPASGSRHGGMRQPVGCWQAAETAAVAPIQSRYAFISAPCSTGRNATTD
jgi:hypothetical protein